MRPSFFGKVFTVSSICSSFRRSYIVVGHRQTVGQVSLRPATIGRGRQPLTDCSINTSYLDQKTILVTGLIGGGVYEDF
jgi:hypothetical protein